MEYPSNGHFGTVILSFVGRLSFIGKSKMYWNYGEKLFFLHGASNRVLCREIVLISERPLSGDFTVSSKVH